jgi:hypothetical protein
VVCVAALLAACATAPAPDQAAACDRDCLIALADRYAAALVAGDASGLPIAADLRYTENLVPLAFGREGLWRTVDGARDYDIHVADPALGDVVWFGIVREMGRPVMTAVRLKVEGRTITEAEMLVGRISVGAADAVEGPRPGLEEIVPEALRSSREQLIAIASSNWDAMEQGDGDLAPYADDCERYDNGRRMTGEGEPGSVGSLGCHGQMHSGRFKYGNVVEPRRVWAVDVERGLVVGMYNPNVPGDLAALTLRDGTVIALGRDEQIPFTIMQAEMFKVVGGEIVMVEVVLGPRVPYGMRSPFDMETLWERPAGSRM